jgi:Ca2+-binding EF-hand superfamily protein
VKNLVSQIDFNKDGSISFEELCESLHILKINLTMQERHALMKKLDVNQDGEITEEEIFKTISHLEGHHHAPAEVHPVAPRRAH